MKEETKVAFGYLLLVAIPLLGLWTFGEKNISASEGYVVGALCSWFATGMYMLYKQKEKSRWKKGP